MGEPFDLEAWMEANEDRMKDERKGLTTEALRKLDQEEKDEQK